MRKEDFCAYMNVGESEPIMDSWAAPIVNGVQTTNTISGSPTYTLYDPTGAIVTGHNAQACTGFDNTAVVAPRVWKTINSLSPTVLTAGTYRIVFSFTVTNSADSIARPKVRIGNLHIFAIP